jgi:glyoxylase-like metal-dependent hydrolase (beta-lactamase superfamily II)
MRKFIAALVAFVCPSAFADVMTLDEMLAAFGWDFDSAVIEAQKIDDGFYVLFGVGGNIGVSIGEQGVLIVDDQFPQMMPKIKAKIAELGGGDIDFAVNTHWHFDHAEGNLTLGPEGTWVVSQSNSRDMMAESHIINLVAMQYEQQAYPEDAKAVITYDDRMQFHFNGEQIDLVHYGPAHTTGDTAVIFRGVNAVHFGDVFNAGYPFIDADNGGDIEGMIAFCSAVLDEIDSNTHVIPGHGPVSDYDGLVHYIHMLTTVRGRLAGMIAEGLSLEEIAAAKPTAEFDAQFGDPSGFIDRAYTSLMRD